MKIPINIINLFILIMILCGCQQSEKAAAINFPKLDYQQQVFNDATVVKGVDLPPLELTRNNAVVQVNSCASFLHNIAVAAVVESVNNMRVAANYQFCITNQLVSRASGSQKSYYANNFSQLITEQLNLLSFNSSLRPMLEASKNTFKSLPFFINSVKNSHQNNEVIIQTEDWRYQFTLVAQGDFTQDSSEDLLVIFIDEATESNYYSVQTLVLVRSELQDLWRALPAVGLLGAKKVMLQGK